MDGIYTADPRLVPEARLLEEIDSRDMLRLAEAGSQVLHPESVRACLEAGTELWLRSSFRALPGTAVRLLPPERRPDFAGITRDLEKGSLTLVGPAAGRGIAERLLALLEREGIPAALLESGEGSVRLSVAPALSEEALRLVHREIFRD